MKSVLRVGVFAALDSLLGPARDMSRLDWVLQVSILWIPAAFSKVSSIHTYSAGIPAKESQ